MRTRSVVHVACPVCGYRLRGSTTEGYRCIRCHAHYSTAFMRRVRKQQFSDTIHQHFSLTERSEEQTIVIQDEKEEIPATIESAVKEADEGLERYIDISEVEHLPPRAQMPHEVMAPEPRVEYSGFPSSPETHVRTTKKSSSESPSRKPSQRSAPKRPTAKSPRKRTMRRNSTKAAPQRKASNRRR